MRKHYSAFLQFLLVFGLMTIAAMQTANAQLALTRSYFSSPYVSIAGAPGAVLSTATGDDVVEASIPIGFGFNFLGIGRSSVDVNTNGAMTFAGAGLLGSTSSNSELFASNAPDGVITAWWDDLTCDTSGGIWTQTIGTPGNRVFTVEWKNFYSYWVGATQRLNFQICLFETTNIIEFRYGPRTPGTTNTGESASIGCESSTGGPGNYLDVVTGSSNIGNYFIQAATGWPTRNYRLTPGAPTPMPAGTYTAGSTGFYPNLTEAIAAINNRGIAGPVVISLTDATYTIDASGGENWFPIALGAVNGSNAVNTITIQPATGTSTLTYEGSTAGNMASTGNIATSSTTSEAIFALYGTDYVTVNNLNLNCSQTGIVDRGLFVVNNSATDGATFNTFSGITVQLNRSNTSSIGIAQTVANTPTGPGGSNSNNIYRNLNISNANSGIYLLGNASFPDFACQITTSGPNVFNTIGGSTANDIGGNSVQAFGIRASNLSGATINNNNVQNVAASTTTDGIFVELSQGTTNVFRNRVSNVRYTGTGTTGITGIRANVATTAGHSLRVYNNSVCNITSAYAGAGVATRQIKGIFVQSAGGGLNSSNINVDNNSVLIDASSSPTISSSCFELGTTSGPIINTRNNIFMNMTGAQVSPSTHVGIRSTSSTSMGAAGSSSNRNDIYIPNSTQGFTGIGNATTYATLANWQAAMVGQDVNSVAGDPGYLNPAACDLHATAAITNDAASVVAWVTGDIDNQTRSLTTPDIGFDEYTPTTLDVGATAMIAPLSGTCYTAAEGVTIRVRNWAINPINFATNNALVTLNVTGPIPSTVFFPINSGTLAPGAFQDYLVGTVNMSAAGTYTFNATATTVGDQNTGNDAMPTHTRVFSAGTAVAIPSRLCGGDSTTITLSGQNGNSILWEVSTNNGLTWSPTFASNNPYRVSPTDTAWYRAKVCGLIYSVFDTVNVIDVTPPTTIGDTICGTGTVALSAAGAANLDWYTQMTGGTLVHSGTTYTPTLSTTTTYYVEGVNAPGTGLHTTTFAAGNGSSGNAFTIKSLSGITVTGFDGHTNSTAPGDWEIWYRPNDYLLTPGSQTSTTGWTQLGTATGVPGMGNGLPTPIPINFAVNIPAGQTYSFQVFTTTGGVNYTNGTALGAVYNQNADLQFFQGHGGTAFAGMTLAPRVFNGRIHYTVGCPTARTPVTAVVNPAAAVNISSPSTFSCDGDPLTLTANSVNTSYVYTWSPGATLNTTSGPTVIATPLVSTQYIVSATDSIGCHTADTLDITYVQRPVVTAAANPGTICAADSLTLDVTVTPHVIQVGNGVTANTSTNYPSPYGNWFWGSRHQMLILASELQAMNVSAGYLNTMAFDVVNLNGSAALDNFEIKLALTNVSAITAFQTPTFTSVFTAVSYTPAMGVVPVTFTTPFWWDGVSNILVETCHNNASNSTNVSVNQSSTAFTSTVYYRADAAGVCSNASVTASIAERPNIYFTMDNPVTYIWSPSTDLVAPTAATTMGTAAANTTFGIVVTDSISGCTGTDSVVVTVNPLPMVNLGADTTLCGSSTVLDAGNPGASYLWSTADTTQQTTANGGGTYSVVVTDGNGCAGYDTLVLAFIPDPVVNLGPDTTVCQGTPVVFDAGNPGATYAWSNNATTQTITVTAVANYSVTVTNAGGCAGSDTVRLDIHTLPFVGFTSTIDTLCTFSAPVTLTGGTPLGGTYSGNGVSAGVFNPATAGPGAQNLTYSYTDTNGCTGSATHLIVVEICPGIADGLDRLDLSVFPNPNDGRFAFSLPLQAATEVRYTLTDAKGTIVMRALSIQPSGVYTQQVDLNALPSGMYTLRVQADGATAVKRVVLQR